MKNTSKHIDNSLQDNIMSINSCYSFGADNWGSSSVSGNSSNYTSFINNWNPPGIVNMSGGDIDGPGYSVCFNDNITVAGTAGVDKDGPYAEGTVTGNASASCIASVWSGNYDDNNDGVDDWSGDFDDPGSC